jgi:NADH-quinone oxidoreductase subunit G
MCDTGRLGFHYIHREDRLRRPLVRVGENYFPGAWGDVLRQVVERFSKYKGSEVAIVGSARGTLEELFLLRELGRLWGVDETLMDVLPRWGKGDGVLRSEDLNPNSAGARLLGVGKDGRMLGVIREGILGGRVRALFVFHEDVVKAGIGVEVLERLELLVVEDILPSGTSGVADYVLAGASFAEKRGSMISGGGRLQRLNRAIRPPGEAREDWEVLRDLWVGAGGKGEYEEVDDVFRDLVREFEGLEGLSLNGLGDEGVDVRGCFGR